MSWVRLRTLVDAGCVNVYVFKHDIKYIFIQAFNQRRSYLMINNDTLMLITTQLLRVPFHDTVFIHVWLETNRCEHLNINNARSVEAFCIQMSLQLKHFIAL